MKQWFSVKGSLFSQEHLAMSRDIFGRHSWCSWCVCGGRSQGSCKRLPVYRTAPWQQRTTWPEIPVLLLLEKPGLIFYQRDIQNQKRWLWKKQDLKESKKWKLWFTKCCKHSARFSTYTFQSSQQPLKVDITGIFTNEEIWSRGVQYLGPASHS